MSTFIKFVGVFFVLMLVAALDALPTWALVLLAIGAPLFAVAVARETK